MGGKKGDPTGVSSRTETRNFSIYPNPASEVLFVDGGTQNGSPMNISIYNITGNLVLQKTLYGNFTAPLDVSELRPGIYIFRIQQGGYMDSKKFLITP